MLKNLSLLLLTSLLCVSGFDLDVQVIEKSINGIRTTYARCNVSLAANETHLFPSFIWYKNNSEVLSESTVDPNFKGHMKKFPIHESVLIIGNATREDEDKIWGNYRCEAKVGDEKKVMIVDLKVTDRDSGLVIYETPIGKNVSIACPMDKDVIHARWVRNDSVIENSKSPLLWKKDDATPYCTLNLTNVSEDDMGVYMCEALDLPFKQTCRIMLVAKVPLPESTPGLEPTPGIWPISIWLFILLCLLCLLILAILLDILCCLFCGKGITAKLSRRYRHRRFKAKYKPAKKQHDVDVEESRGSQIPMLDESVTF